MSYETRLQDNDMAYPEEMGPEELGADQDGQIDQMRLEKELAQATTNAGMRSGQYDYPRLRRKKAELLRKVAMMRELRPHEKHQLADADRWEQRDLGETFNNRLNSILEGEGGGEGREGPAELPPLGTFKHRADAVEQPPPPRKAKRKHPLPRPVYPGSMEDRARKAKKKAIEAERSTERNQFNAP